MKKRNSDFCYKCRFREDILNMENQYNMRNPAVKRLMKEAQELKDPTEQYYAQPLEDNLFEWHFTIRGPGETEFADGIYHGRIILPPGYPMKPPSIILLTPQGRFELHTKICLSISGHHPESWRPSWSIRTALLAIIGFMPTHGGGAIGSLDYSANERKVLARKSREWSCPQCGNIRHLLKPVTEASKETEKEAKQLAAQIHFQGEQAKAEGDASTTKNGSEPVCPGTPSDPTQESEPTTVSSTEPSATGPVAPPALPPGMWQSLYGSTPLAAPPSTDNESTTPDQQQQQQQASPTTAEVRQRATGAPAVAAATPQSAPPVTRTVVRAQYDYVSFLIVTICSLFITLILIRRLGVVDMDMLKQLYDQM